MAYKHSKAFFGTALVSLIVASLAPSTSVFAQDGQKAPSASYVGTYEVSPTKTLSVTLEGETLYAQVTGARKFELIWVFGHNFTDGARQQVVKFVVDATGKVSSVTHVDPSPLADAVLAGDVDKVRALIEDGADIHSLDTRPGTAGGNGRRPLNHAALSNDVDMINTLLALGADINRQNLSGFTPLHHAVEVQSEAAIALLVSQGADTTIKNGRNLTPEEMAGTFGLQKAAAALAKALEGK